MEIDSHSVHLSNFCTIFAGMFKKVHDILVYSGVAIFLVAFYGCSASKFVPDDRYILESVKITSKDKHVDALQLEPYIKQKANSKWFSVFKIPLGAYALSGRDSTKWMNRTLRKIGEKPVIFDSLQAKLSQEDLRSALQNMGYMHAAVDVKVRAHSRKADVEYVLRPGTPYFIRNINYDIQDDNIRKLLDSEPATDKKLKVGARFTVDVLDAERKRITKLLMNNGFYKFHKDFIQYDADSASNSNDINVTMHLLKYRATSNSPETLHPKYVIRKINFLSGDNDSILHLRRKVLDVNTVLTENQLYSSSDLQRTYNNFARMQAIRYTNIKFREVPDSMLLDCDIQTSMNKPNTLSFQPEGTNTSGDLGAAASLTYSNRNLFHGSEMLSVQLRGAFEAITGLEGYQDQNYQEYSLEAKLQLPRFLAPFLSRSFIRRSTATSELGVSYDMQNRPEFQRRVFSAAWRYRWNNPKHNTSYRFGVVDFNYIRMPWISSTFKRDYLDSVSTRNAILRYNYEDLLIMKIGIGITYNNGVDVIRTNFETAGNILNFLSKTTGAKMHDGQYKYFNIAYAQYVKGDIDYTHLIQFNNRNALALHADFGVAYPYGNSTILPFDKRYFSGGANSVRGWGVRELGPGKYRGSNGSIDFINQTGDIKLDMNVESRTYLFWKFDGAVFVDAGNIWTIRNYDDQPGGQFKFDEFYKQIAVAYGVGLRLNFGYFILRFDFGMKAVNPAYDSEEEHYAILHPKWHRDSTFHFAVGLPF